VYNLKEAMLAKCYIEVLGLDRHSDAAQRLIKWKQPVDGQVSQPDPFMGQSGDETYLTLTSRLNPILATLLEYATMRFQLVQQSKKGNSPSKLSTRSWISSLPAV
jgi:hypothetical protein